MSSVCEYVTYKPYCCLSPCTLQYFLTLSDISSTFRITKPYVKSAVTSEYYFFKA
ncbi:UNVERIFIED_CONTAM: hypothetical protein FKN15_030540 [Acipenser sinensis]